MGDAITIVMMGQPVPYARSAGGQTRARFTPAKQRNAAATLRLLAQQEMQGRKLLDEPLRLDFLAEFTIPASWSKRKQSSAVIGDIYPAKRPDASNLLKLAEDALNGVVYRDDALLCEIHVRKVYGPQPKIIVTVRSIK